jgi:hypothetical protein
LLEFDQRARKRAEDALKHPYFSSIPADMLKIAGINETLTDRFVE